MDLINLIKETINKKYNAVIAIDGMCASGKTTLSKHLSEQFGTQVIHMDDFFLPFEMRTPERLSQPGGNVHYERFKEEVIAPIMNGKDFEYRIFDCSTGSYREKKAILHSEPIIIEGAYSMHPEIPDIYDLKFFCETDPETQIKRIEKRNGTQALTAFREKWIPFENRYFEFFGIREKCDLTVSTEITQKKQG